MLDVQIESAQSNITHTTGVALSNALAGCVITVAPFVDLSAACSAYYDQML